MGYVRGRDEMSLPIRKQQRKYTYKDYLTWDDEERWELLDGIPYNMSPAPSRRHQECVGELYRFFGNYLENKKCRTYIAPFEVCLLLKDESHDDENIENVVQPDVLIVCDEEKLTERGCKGSPDLVVEVLSPATAKKDRNEKLKLYEQAEIKEYWIVDPVHETIEVFSLQTGKYGHAETYSIQDDLKVGIFEDLIMNVRSIFSE